MNTASGRGFRHELLVYLIGREDPRPLICLAFLTHAHPSVGIDRVRSGNRFVRIGEQMNVSASLAGNFARRRHNLRIRLVARRSRDAYRRSQARASKQQRVRDIVSVPDVGQAAILHISETLHQGEIVRQRLARMFDITKRVDHRHTRVLRHAFDGLLRKSAQHNHVHPALQVVRHVAQRFAGTETLLSLVDEHRQTAQPRHSSLESQPGSQGSFLEEHHHLLARRAPFENRRDAP